LLLTKRNNSFNNGNFSSFKKIKKDEELEVENIVIKEGNKLAIIKYEVGKKNEKDTKVVEIWNIKPEKPSFLGMKIENLYNFFMIFVFMAGTASIILFLLSKKLLVMMHGVK